MIAKRLILGVAWKVGFFPPSHVEMGTRIRVTIDNSAQAKTSWPPVGLTMTNCQLGVICREVDMGRSRAEPVCWSLPLCGSSWGKSAPHSGFRIESPGQSCTGWSHPELFAARWRQPLRSGGEPAHFHTFKSSSDFPSLSHGWRVTHHGCTSKL